MVTRSQYKKGVYKKLVALLRRSAWGEGLRLLDGQPERIQELRGFGLLRAAVLQGMGARRQREQHLLALGKRFPQDVEIALEVAEYWLDRGRTKEAAAWVKRGDAAFKVHRPRNAVEMAESLVRFKAEVLARRGRLKAARRLIVVELQRMPDSWALASALKGLWSTKHALVCWSGKGRRPKHG